MRMILACAAIGALAACAPAETEAEVEEEAAPMEEVAVTEPGGVAAGSYTVANDDGSEDSFSIDADGNWSSTDDEGNAVTGTSAVADGKICFTTDGETESRCWTNDPAGEDGSFSSTSDEGETVTVTPAE